MTPTLDLNLPHGTVFGDHEHGAAYEQNGFFFDAKRRFIEGAVDEAQREKLQALAARDEALDKARLAYAEATGATAEEAAEVLKLAKVGTDKNEAVDLVAWGKGQKKYPMDRVTAAIRDEYNVGATNRRQCMEVLASRGLIPALDDGLPSTIPAA